MLTRTHQIEKEVVILCRGRWIDRASGGDAGMEIRRMKRLFVLSREIDGGSYLEYVGSG